MLSKLTIDEVKAMAKAALKVHPHSEPIDLYKYFFHADSGPSHMRKEKDIMAQMIYEEATAMDTSYHPAVQELGDTYIRLSLSLIDLNSMKDSEMLTDWMLASCIDDSDLNNNFHKLWPGFIDSFQELLPADQKQWQETITLANYGIIPSHSKLFHEHYDPHYRVVNKHLTDYYNYFIGENK